MNNIVAYIDEYSAFGFKFDKLHVSSHFIITATIINENDIPSVTETTNRIKQKYGSSDKLVSRVCVALSVHKFDGYNRFSQIV